jgi:hypothetical protein
MSRPSSGVTYKDVDSDWKLDVFASLTIATSYNHFDSFELVLLFALELVLLWDQLRHGARL